MFDWTENKIEQLCELIAQGKSVREISRMDGFPAESTIYRKMNNDSDFERSITRARDAQQESEMEYCIELADSATPEDWQVKKLQIWARQWRAARLLPKKWGDKITNELTGPDGGPIYNAVEITSDIENRIKEIATIQGAIQPPSGYAETPAE